MLWYSGTPYGVMFHDTDLGLIWAEKRMHRRMVRGPGSGSVGAGAGAGAGAGSEADGVYAGAGTGAGTHFSHSGHLW